MSSRTRKRKLQAHVIGALIAFAIAVTTIVPLIIINIQVINRGYNALDIARMHHEERMLEAIKVTYNETYKTINITNIGGITVRIIRIWIKNNTGLYILDASHILNDVELTPGESTTNKPSKPIPEPELIGVETSRANIFYYSP